MIIDAPAKLNLSLRVLRRRDDGFHDIDSVMVKLPGLCDEIRIEPADEDSFFCNVPGIPTDDSNLVIKALLRFRETTGVDDPVAISLEKRIPHGAGLGGGSSDAAMTIMALNQLLGGGLDASTMEAVAAEIGSDVPFFLGPPVGRVRGRGELLEAGPTLPRLEVLLLKPSFGVSTPTAYKAWKGAKPVHGIDFSPQTFEWGELVNDLERPVFGKHLFLAEMRAWMGMRDELAGALMSGSGSTMFGILKPGRDAAAVIAAAKSELDPSLWAWSGELGAGAGR